MDRHQARRKLDAVINESDHILLHFYELQHAYEDGYLTIHENLIALSENMIVIQEACRSLKELL